MTLKVNLIVFIFEEILVSLFFLKVTCKLFLTFLKSCFKFCLIFLQKLEVLLFVMHVLKIVFKLKKNSFLVFYKNRGI